HRALSFRSVGKVVRVLQREVGKRLAETVSGSADYNLLTVGNSLYVEPSAQQIVDILKNARQPMLAICLSDTVRRVRANIQGGKKHCRPAERSAARRKNAS